jgi:hypothetical protein
MLDTPTTPTHTKPDRFDLEGELQSLDGLIEALRLLRRSDELLTGEPLAHNLAALFALIDAIYDQMGHVNAVQAGQFPRDDFGRLVGPPPHPASGEEAREGEEGGEQPDEKPEGYETYRANLESASAALRAAEQGELGSITWERRKPGAA